MTTAGSNPLFSPLPLAGHELRNRLALVATLTNFGAGNRVTERWSDFLIERARGGVGLVVSEIIAVDPQALANPSIVQGFDDANRAGFAHTAAAVKRAGAVLVGQLWHPGRQQLWHPTRSPMGVSDQPDPYSWTVPHVMSEAELTRVSGAYVDVAVGLATCGFHGIELHGAHGYLITQLLSPWSNTRADRFGGSRAGRLRFCIDTARAIRERCGNGFVIGLKMPADEGVAGGIDADEAALMTADLAATGLFDYLAYSQGNFSHSLENHVPDMHFEPGHFIALHKRMRAAAAGVPVMGIGRIGDAGVASRVVGEGYADLVGMSRALIADAAWARKTLAGEAPVPCTYNNQCWGEVHQGKPLAEATNPHLGEAGEAQWQPTRSHSPRRVAVVGAGPAGLEAAWVAAARGHRVTLFGASAQPGGKLRLEAGLPGHAPMAQVTAYQLALAERHGVHIALGAPADIDAVRACRPDAVVLATGARLRSHPALPVHDPRVISAHEAARALAADDLCGGRTAVVFDQDHGAAIYAVTQALAERFASVVLLTPRTEIAQAVNYCSRLGIYRRLYGLGVRIEVAAEPTALEDSILRWRNVFSGREETIDEVDRIVYATSRSANDELAASLDKEFELRVIGDCLAPRNLLIAIHEGHAVGNLL